MKVDEKVDELKSMLGAIEMEVLARPFTLADAIREGAGITTQSYNWTDKDGGMCAMSAAVISARARGYISK